MRNLLQLIFIGVFFAYQVIYVRADYVDPVAKTNINQQTDLFQKSVDDVRGFENQIEGGKNAAIDGLRNSSKTMEEISGKTQHEIQSEIVGLKNIKANDLNEQGSRAVNESDILNEIYFDENATLYAEHRKDAELIASSTANLLNNLLIKLKEIGVDCQQVRGNKEIEPEYHIEMVQKPDQDAKYDPHFCENLRNQYNCRDELNIKCLRKGKKYSDWVYRTIRLDGGYLHEYKGNWGFAIKRCRKNWDWFISPHHPKETLIEKYFNSNKQIDSPWRNNSQAIINDARIYLAQKLGVFLEQIREDIRFPHEGRGIGRQWNGPRWRKIWQEYEFGYYYRDVADTCEAWSEDWNEECRL